MRKICMSYLIMFITLFTSLHFSILTACADSSEDNTFSYIINADDSITITGIYENKEKIIIPSQYQGKSVKKIDDYAFWNNDCIKSVELSDGIEEIGVSAFGYCTSLSNVVLPANTFIYHDAFRNCPELTSIIIPREVKLEEHIVNEKNAYTVFGYLDLPVSAGSSAVVEQKNQIFTIYGYTDTAAEVYANENGFTFIPLDEQPTTTTTTEPIITTTTASTTIVSTDEIKIESTTDTTTTVTTDGITTVVTTEIETDTEQTTATTTITTETDTEPTTMLTTTDTPGNITTESSTVTTVTTTGTDTTLPQTGYSKWYQVIAGLAVCMTGIGGAMVIGCGKLKKKKR